MTNESEQHGDAVSGDETLAGDYEGADAAAADVLDTAARTPGRARVRLIPVIAVVAAAAAVAAVALVSKYLNSTLSPAAFVTQSAQRTLSERTADMTLSGTVSAGNQSVPLHGTGEANLAADRFEISLHASLAGNTLSEREIAAGGSFYLAVSTDGMSISQIDGGRPWVAAPLRQPGTARANGANPSSALSVLEQSGNKVRKLGEKAVGGITCTGYAVTTSKRTVIIGAKTALAAGGVPAKAATGELKAAENMRPPVYKIWISAQGLLRRMSVHLRMRDALASPADANMTMDFTDYGVPVHITAPAPSKTISYASLKRLEGASG